MLYCVFSLPFQFIFRLVPYHSMGGGEPWTLWLVAAIALSDLILIQFYLAVNVMPSTTLFFFLLIDHGHHVVFTEWTSLSISLIPLQSVECSHACRPLISKSNYLYRCLLCHTTCSPAPRFLHGTFRNVQIPSLSLVLYPPALWPSNYIGFTSLPSLKLGALSIRIKSFCVLSPVSAPPPSPCYGCPTANFALLLDSVGVSCILCLGQSHLVALSHTHLGPTNELTNGGCSASSFPSLASFS